MSHYSWTALDVGFDLRAHPEMALEIPSDCTSATYDCADGTREIAGTCDEIRKALQSAGYRVTIRRDEK